MRLETKIVKGKQILKKDLIYSTEPNINNITLVFTNSELHNIEPLE